MSEWTRAYLGKIDGAEIWTCAVPPCWILIEDMLHASPHRILVTASGDTSPVTVRYYFMPLYGPQELFEFYPNTACPAAREADKESK